MAQNEITYDKLGYCCKCHKQIGEFEKKTGELIGWKEMYTAELKLSSASVMYVALCKVCYDTLGENDFVALMESVVRGWDKELESTDWDDARKTEYKTTFYGLKILTRLR